MKLSILKGLFFGLISFYFLSLSADFHKFRFIITSSEDVFSVRWAEGNTSLLGRVMTKKPFFSGSI